MKILHISDPHYQMETMERLDSLARRRTDCDVVAVTGDLVSQSHNRLPAEWNSWPQKIKLAVPGNHDDFPRVFKRLTMWQTSVPLCNVQNSVLFLCAGVQLDDIAPKKWLRFFDESWDVLFHAMVILTHCRPHGKLLRRCLALARGRPVLILHGHDHSRSFSGMEWSVPADGEGVYRSRVCSSQVRLKDGTVARGCGQVIDLDTSGGFSATYDQGEDGGSAPVDLPSADA